MNDAFELEVVEPRPGVALVRVHGTLDAHTAPQLIDRCRIAHAGTGAVVLSLASVSFIASSGVGALLALVEETRQGGVTLRIAAPSPPVASAIRLLGLHDFLGIDDTEAAALTAVAA